MQFRDLQEQYRQLKSEIDKAIQDVLKEGNFISGHQVTDLEEKLADYVGTKYCVTCGNGTDALSMALMSWNIGTGDAVFVPDFTFFSSGEVVAFENATPVFYDVDSNTFNSDVNSLENAIKSVIAEGTLVPKAIIAVDLFGQPANYIEIEKIAEKYDLLLLEDGAQGFGGKIGNKKACSFGNMGTTSFFPAKPLGCYGDGGAIFTNDKETADYLKSIRVHGKGKMKYDNIRIGWNSRLDTVQAAILLVKLKAFQEFELAAVNRVSNWYSERLKDVVKTPHVMNGFYSSWAQYTIQLDNSTVRNALQSKLKELEIPTMIYYPKPLHHQTAFHDVKQYVKCDVAEMLCERVLALPMHPYLSEEKCEYICDKVKKCLLEI